MEEKHILYKISMENKMYVSKNKDTLCKGLDL